MRYGTQKTFLTLHCQRTYVLLHTYTLVSESAIFLINISDNYQLRMYVRMIHSVRYCTQKLWSFSLRCTVSILLHSTFWITDSFIYNQFQVAICVIRNITRKIRKKTSGNTNKHQYNCNSYPPHTHNNKIHSEYLKSAILRWYSDTPSIHKR